MDWQIMEFTVLTTPKEMPGGWQTVATFTVEFESIFVQRCCIVRRDDREMLWGPTRHVVMRPSLKKAIQRKAVAMLDALSGVTSEA